MVEELLRQEFYHNRLSDYLLCLAIIVGGIVTVRIVEAAALRRLQAWAEKTSTRWDDFLVDRIHRTGIPLAYLGIVQAALRVLTLTPRVERIIDMAGIALLTLVVIVFTVDGNDYTRYMDLQQKANLRIYEEFGKRRIEFAYPTQTLYLTKV